ncbi:MAG: hypothetical protein RR198_08335 [Oscillospiraceae bacterium]
MLEFIMGFLLGALLILSITQYKRWKTFLMGSGGKNQKNSEGAQWQNMMNYSGDERGQEYFEN